MSRRPTLAVWKFASCDGCQLTLLDCEDELLAVADAWDVAMFPEASSAMRDGPYDLSLVEGSITTAHDAERIRAIREASRRLVAIGACATAGGIQALRNMADLGAWTAAVYARPDYVETLATSTAISHHVAVDFELRGCPVSKAGLLDLLAAFRAGRRPAVTDHAVCVECKARGTVCVMAAKGVPCLGPATHAGCGALCPAFDRGCYGCFGPMEGANTAALSAQLAALGVSPAALARLWRSFVADAPAFREEAARHERP
jgi:coenzyme F420-reducing hydrogenase gamma subunit